MVVNIAATEAVLALVILVAFLVSAPDPNLVVIAVVAAGTQLVTPLLFYPWAKTIWAAIDLQMRPLEPHETAGLSRPGM